MENYPTAFKNWPSAEVNFNLLTCPPLYQPQKIAVDN